MSPTLLSSCEEGGVERTMSVREAERGGVLARVLAHALTLGEGAEVLGLSYRQARRLLARYRAGGVQALRHRSVGRPSNRAHPAAVRARVLALTRAEYSGPAGPGPGQRFGPTLLVEHLAAEHGLVVPVSTLRRWLRAAGLWTRRRRRRLHRQRRPRAAHFGELVQLDGSFHDWFEGRGPWPVLLTLVDDATGTTLAQFVPAETTWSVAALLEAWSRRYGVPRALYTDWHGAYHRAPTASERDRSERRVVTQFGRMCRQLGIALLAAGSPQAKGRVERNHGTHQDRLVKKLRRVGITDLTAANAFLSDYLTQHNARYAIAPAAAADYHRPWPVGRAARDVFCLEQERVVGRDYVVQYAGQALQLTPHARFRLSPQSRVLVRETVDGTLRVLQIDARGREHEFRWTPAPPRVPKPAPPTVPAAPHPVVVHRPAADHPWRRQIHQWAQDQQQHRRSVSEVAAGHP
jgi:transposase